MSSYCETAGHTMSTTENNRGMVHQICVMCGHERDHDEVVTRAVDQITHSCDGPATSFVIVARAMRAVANGAHPTVMANAVAIALNLAD